MLKEAKNLFGKLNMVIIRFFGGFVSLFLIMFIIKKASLLESILLGIIGYVIIYFIWFIWLAFTASANRLVDTYPYARKFSSVKRKLLFDPKKLLLNIDAMMTIEVQSNINNLRFVRHNIGMGENRAMKFENVKIIPRYDKFKRSNGEIKFERTQSTKTSQWWRMIFNPGLKKDERAFYKVEWNYPGAKFLSFEEFSEAKTRHQIPSDRNVESFSRSCQFPCEKLISTVQFPVGYPISNPYFSVKIGGHEVEEEIKRIVLKKYFKFMRLTSDKGWELILEVEKPLLSVAYIIQWEPPSLDLLIKENFINEDQRDIIIQRMKKQSIE